MKTINAEVAGPAEIKTTEIKTTEIKTMARSAVPACSASFVAAVGCQAIRL